MRPVSCPAAASGPSIIKVMKSMAKGRYLESKVMMKKDTERVGLSWANVYAYARDRAGRKVYAFRMPPAVAAITLPTNRVYTKKSPGCAKRLDSRSMELPYWYRKYGSSRIANFGFVIRNAVKMRQS